jgi:hypothetical protein
MHSSLINSFCISDKSTKEYRIRWRFIIQSDFDDCEGINLIKNFILFNLLVIILYKMKDEKARHAMYF